MSEEDEITKLADATPQEIVTNALQTIPFENLIGGPLTACVKAQEMAAEATWRYIKEVGFSPSSEDDRQEAIIISFLFQQDNVIRKLSMPLLTLVPVPYISINTVDLAFRADMSASSEGELMAKFSTTKDSKVQSQYNIQNVVDINIRATSGHMPAGIAKMLDLFSNSCIQVRDYEQPKEELTEDKKEMIGSIIEALEDSAEKATTPVSPAYNVELIGTIEDKDKAKIVGVIMKAAGDLTEEEILARFKTTNKTIVTNVSLNKAEEIVKAIKAAGGDAQYKKV